MSASHNTQSRILDSEIIKAILLANKANPQNAVHSIIEATNITTAPEQRLGWALLEASALNPEEADITQEQINSLLSALIEQGVDVNSTCQSGNTALLEADNENTISFLLSRGADPLIKNANGLNIIQELAEEDYHTTSLALVLASLNSKEARIQALEEAYEEAPPTTLSTERRL